MPNRRTKLANAIPPAAGPEEAEWDGIIQDLCAEHIARGDTPLVGRLSLASYLCSTLVGDYEGEGDLSEARLERVVARLNALDVRARRRICQLLNRPFGG